MSLSEEQLDRLIAVERSRESEPLNEWRTIAARAREEGLIRESESRPWASSQPWLQAAAAIILLLGGIAIGRTTIGLPTVSPSSQSTASVSSPAPEPAVTPVSDAPAALPNTTSFASVDEATNALERAVTVYQHASQFIAANNLSERTRDSATIYRARAEALDKIVNATKSALQTAPHDPVINQYYLATMGASVATRQAYTVGLRGF